VAQLWAFSNLKEVPKFDFMSMATFAALLSRAEEVLQKQLDGRG
jgi:hypothetical protein